LEPADELAQTTSATSMLLRTFAYKTAFAMNGFRHEQLSPL
jgi:hypothetical protein